MGTESLEVLTFGEPLVAFYPASGVTVARSVGGAELNFARALAHMGSQVTYVARVGDDPFGSAIRERLEAAGIDARVTVDPNAPTGVYFREPAHKGGRRVYYYRTGSAASKLEPADLPPFEPYRLVHTTGITAALSTSCRRTVEAAAGSSRFSLDINFRPALWHARSCREVLLPLLPRAELVFVSDEDADVVTPEDALAAGAHAVVHTRGALGARYLDQEGAKIEASSLDVDAVDTVGAGDAFAAGFAQAWIAGADPADCLRQGARLGAEAVRAPGDSL